MGAQSSKHFRVSWRQQRYLQDLRYFYQWNSQQILHLGLHWFGNQDQAGRTYGNEYSKYLTVQQDNDGLFAHQANNAL